MKISKNYLTFFLSIVVWAVLLKVRNAIKNILFGLVGKIKFSTFNSNTANATTDATFHHQIQIIQPIWKA